MRDPSLAPPSRPGLRRRHVDLYAAVPGLPLRRLVVRDGLGITLAAGGHPRSGDPAALEHRGHRLGPRLAQAHVVGALAELYEVINRALLDDTVGVGMADDDQPAIFHLVLDEDRGKFLEGGLGFRL